MELARAAAAGGLRRRARQHRDGRALSEATTTASDARARARRSPLASLARLAAVLGLGVLTAVFGVTTVGIDGSSMEPTIHDGERALVPRYETWWVLLRGASWDAGDVVYFRPPGAAPKGWVDRITGGPFLIKRVAAIAGQTVGLERGRLVVDGTVVAEPYLEGAPRTPIGVAARRVPPEHVFVLGDNRAPLASRDSRAFGPVPLAQVAGRAAWVVWPPLRRDADGVWRWNVHRL
ncbi:MAG: signal peptidase I [Trueperaceae bacterium]|nr:signal peptidase I [Trueperaceae bacterium]